VAYDGTTTLAFARAEPLADFRTGSTERYDRASAAVEGAFRPLGLEPIRGEPDDSFCPGTHSLSVASADGRQRKVVGIAQRVRSDAALVAGIVLVAAREKLAAVLERVYDALAVPLDPASVGTVAAAGGPSDPDAVRTALEEGLLGDASDVSIERIGDGR
ncbi:lipoate--protein ligase, partial [Natrinema sp. J7-1]|uniref:lipoate--protein ligase n=1 Tax=Natrinema sp. J7-1 TaxID=1172566 RepID=UPI0006776337